MASILLDKFGGMLPAWYDQHLPEGQAASAINTYLYPGTLCGWRKPKLLKALTNSAAKCAYRIPDDENADTTLTAASTWLEFEDIDTDVVRSPVVDDTYNRYYFASPSLLNVSSILGPQYNTHDRIKAGDPAWLLGLPAPACAPGVAVAGGGEIAYLGNDGFSGTEGNGEWASGNTTFLQKVTPAGAMTLQDITFLPQQDDASVRYVGVLYDDDNGVPSNLLNVGDIKTGVTADTEATSPFTNPTGLLADTTYWIGILADVSLFIQNTGIVSDTGNASTAKTFGQPFTNGPALTAPSELHASPNFNIWGNLITSDVLEARSYVYTWITEYGEESPPSPYTLLNGWSNGVWTLTLWSPAAADMGTDRNITTVRIYRTVASEGGTAEYYFVADVDVGTASYEDTATDDTIALNDTLPSTNWFPPPDDLKGMQLMANGIMVGFRENEIWFSEAYRPHAWPPGYVQTVEYPIVGIGVASQSVVACTSGCPFIISGTDPSTMSVDKSHIIEPCQSRGSIVSLDDCVVYISTNGMISVTPSTQAGYNETENWITRERWNELVTPTNLRAQLLATSFMAFNTSAQTGFTIELQNDSGSFSVWPQAGGHRLGFQQMTHPDDVQIDNFMIDVWTGIGLIIRAGSVYYYDFTDQAPDIQPYTWKSKIFAQQARRNYGAMKVYFEVPPSTPTQNTTRKTEAFDDSSWNTLDSDRYGYIKVYADDVLVTVREIRTSGELLRIASGFKAINWQFQIEGRVTITDVQIGSSPKDLARV